MVIQIQACKCCILICIYIYICIQNHNDTIIMTSDTEKYTSHFIWKGSKKVTQGFIVRGSWRPNRTATYWPPLLWPSVLCLSRSLGLLNRRPGGPLRWVLAFSTRSYHQRVWSPNWSPNSHWLPVFTELYNSSIALSISPHDWPWGCVTSAVLGMACLTVIKRK